MCNEVIKWDDTKRGSNMFNESNLDDQFNFFLKLNCIAFKKIELYIFLMNIFIFITGWYIHNVIKGHKKGDLNYFKHMQVT